MSMQDAPLWIFQAPDSSFNRVSQILQFSEVKEEVILNYQQFWKWLRLTGWSRAMDEREKTTGSSKGLSLEKEERLGWWKGLIL